MYLQLIRKSPSITSKLPAIVALAGFAVLWQLLCMTGIVPAYMLPSPVEVLTALVRNIDHIAENAVFTLQETAYGLALGILLSFVTATVMDRFAIIDRAFSPLIIITQTIPTIAIAPILVLWLGYGIAPKIALVVITTYFPITIGLLSGYKSVDRDSVDLMRALGAGRMDIFIHLKFPQALPQFFAGLKIAASYAVVGAVVAEWLGGFNGLGVMMTRMQKAYAFDAMFAIILVIVVISLLLLALVEFAGKATMPWKKLVDNEKEIQ